MNIFSYFFKSKTSQQVPKREASSELVRNPIEALLTANTKVAIHLAHSESPLGLSKLGGLPNVDSSFVWPIWKDRPLGFLGQIDLSALPRISDCEPFPSSGLLYFFYDQDQSTWGFDPKDIGSWKVLYSPDMNSHPEAECPLGLPAESIFQEIFLSPQQRITYPTFERLKIDTREYTPREFDIEEHMRNKARPEGPEHQIGGYPNPMQGDEMELDAQLASNGLYCGDSSGYNDIRASSLKDGSKDWQLLLQLDSDDPAGMMWGDAGMIYFWIKTQDLMAHDFSKVWMVLQCG